MRRGRAGLVVSIVGLACSLTACGGGGGGGAGGGADSSKPIKVGASISLTGAYAGEGPSALNGYKLAVAEINKNGGLFGRKLQLLASDDKSDPGTAIRLYTKLITQDRVDLLIGPYSSPISQAIVPLVEKFQFATVFDEASAPTIFDGTKYAIQGQVSAYQYLPYIIDIAKKHGYKTMAEVGQYTIATQQICEGVNRAAEQAGIKIVYKQSYPKGETDFSSPVLRLKAAHPDIVLGCAYLPDSIPIAKEMHRQGLAPKMFVESIGPAEDEFEKSLGGVADGVIGSTSWWPTLPTQGNKQFISGYKQMFGKAPDYEAADAYAGLKVLARAAEQAGSLDNAKINQEIHSQTYDTVLGTFKVNSTGQQVGYHSYLLQWQGGKLKLVYPPEDAQTGPRLPYGG